MNWQELYEAEDDLDYQDFWETIWQADAAALEDMQRAEQEDCSAA